MNESAAFPWERRPGGLNANSYAMIFLETLALLSIFFPLSLQTRRPSCQDSTRLGPVVTGTLASSRQPPNVTVEPVVSEAPLTQRRPPRSLFLPHRGHRGGWLAPPPSLFR